MFGGFSWGCFLKTRRCEQGGMALFAPQVATGTSSWPSWFMNPYAVIVRQVLKSVLSVLRASYTLTSQAWLENFWAQKLRPPRLRVATLQLCRIVCQAELVEEVKKLQRTNPAAKQASPTFEDMSTCIEILCVNASCGRNIALRTTAV